LQVGATAMRFFSAEAAGPSPCRHGRKNRFGDRDVLVAGASGSWTLRWEKFGEPFSRPTDLSCRSKAVGASASTGDEVRGEGAGNLEVLLHGVRAYPSGRSHSDMRLHQGGGPRRVVSGVVAEMSSAVSGATTSQRRFSAAVSDTAPCEQC